MPQTAAINGTNFTCSVGSITVFKLQGLYSGADWAIGIDLLGDEDYILFEVDPAPVLDVIIEVIEADKQAGNFDSIVHVLVSSRVAVRLFLEGVLKPSDFETAEENEMDTSPFVGGGKVYPYVRLPEVKLGEYTLPLLIFSESKVGANTIATLDSANKIV